MTTRIPIYGLTWHLHQSPALRELVISPLSPYIEFEQFGWDGEQYLLEFEVSKWTKYSIIFFQLPPPVNLCNVPNARIVWIPMWDQARGYDMEWWQRLPKNLRVVSFSNEISQRARAAGLNTLDVRYFLLPNDSELVNWDKQRILFYWNRTGMVGKAFLKNLCRALDVEMLLFRRRPDPGRPAWCDYGMPAKLGKTPVRELSFDSAEGQQEYLKYLNQANIFIAPRLFEGVGLSVIEALARGCAVFAYDAPTMNEYINHLTSGYLLQQRYHSWFKQFQERFTKRLRGLASGLGYKGSWPDHPVTEWQNWSEISKLNLAALGDQARHDQLIGYAAWKNIIPRYASFILDW